MEYGLTKYEEYMRTNELLSLQKDERDLCRPEELTFQMIFQISELHYKLTIQYIELAKAYMEAKCLSRAIDELRKVDTHLKHLLETLNLLDTIRSRDFLCIHRSIGLGSMADSPGFKSVMEMGPRLWEPFKNLLDDRGLTVAELLNKGDLYYELYLLLQEMISFDEIFQVLRNHYIRKDYSLFRADENEEGENSGRALEIDDQYRMFPVIWKALSDQIQSKP